MSKPHVYNMPSGVPFLPSLAMGLREIYSDRLQDALILLPTRRAVRALGNAFVGDTGASLLPRMRPLADINPEEPPFEPGELAGLVKPSIDPMQRRFEMARLIFHYHKNISELPLDAAGALALADPLISILDDADMEEADLSKISELEDIQKFAAEHFQNAITLYKIVQDYWPKRLKEIDVMQPFERRVALLEALTDIWTDEPPKYPVIIAGSTGTLRASARLMRCVAQMDEGMIILPGLNTSVPDDAWADVGVQHPQNSLKALLKTIGIERADVPDWAYMSSGSASDMDARRRVISEALVPIEATGDWPSRIDGLRKGTAKNTDDPFEKALSGLSLLEADNDEEEALAIALIMRETLEMPDKTAALVTPDPALARRVKARLRRWDVEVDYSQGEPLEETQLGAFLAAILGHVQARNSQVNLAVLCKHQLMGIENIKTDWLAFERQLRVGRDRPKLNAFASIPFLNRAFTPLLALEEAPANIWARALAETAEALAATQDSQGAVRLWVNDAGEKAASLIEDLIAYGDYLPDMDIQSFSRLLGNLMRGKVVRPRYGTHPRLSILGPLEARMLTADHLILGGLNEGVWPAAPSIEPFLSRGMRRTLKLSLPERRFGLSAHDFAELAANPNVILTRSKRSDDGPKVKSRWLWRLQTLMRGALGEAADMAFSASQDYLNWARAMDYVPPAQVEKNQIQPPAPKPDPSDRWPRGPKLSITKIKTWIRDPYSIYAQYILDLVPLDDLDRVLDVRDYGNALHQGLEDFTKAYPKSLPKNAQLRLVESFKRAMESLNYPDFDIAKETARLGNIAAQVIPWMTERRASGWSVRGGVEVKGKLKLKIKTHDFTLTGTADLIEKGPLGYAVTDYKTGAPPTAAVVNVGFDPQLPLSALMLREGVFDKQGKGETEELNYIRLKGAGDSTLVEPRANIAGKNQIAKSASEHADFAYEILSNLIVNYAQKDTPYYSQPRAQFTHDYGQYDHLARRDEWMRVGADPAPGEG